MTDQEVNISVLTMAGQRIREHVERRWEELEAEGIPPERRTVLLLKEVSAMGEPNVLTHRPYALTAKNKNDIEHIMFRFKKDTSMLWWHAKQGMGYWKWVADRKRHVDKMSKRRLRARKRAEGSA